MSRQTYEDLAREADLLRSQVKSLKKENAKLVKQNSELNDKISDIVVEFDTSEKLNTKLIDENFALRAKIESYNQVTKASHYNQGDIETIDYIISVLTPEEFAGFCKGTTLRYISRERYKGQIKDIMKGSYYMQKLQEHYPDLSDLHTVEPKKPKYSENVLVDYLVDCHHFFFNKSRTMDHIAEHNRKFYKQLATFLTELAYNIQEGCFETEEKSLQVKPVGEYFGLKAHKRINKQEVETHVQNIRQNITSTEIGTSVQKGQGLGR